MAWRVDRRNEARQQTQTAPQSFNTARQAFDAAWDNMGAFIKASIRAGNRGDIDNPGSESAYKIRVETRMGGPRKVGFELRFDYPTGTPPNNPEGTWETNSIYWQIRQE